MEMILLLGIIIIVVLQALNLIKKVDVKNDGNERIESRLNELDAKLLQVDLGLETKIQAVISKEIINITDRISKGTNETNQTLSKNNEDLVKKFTTVEKNIDKSLSDSINVSIRSSEELKGRLNKEIIEFKDKIGDNLDNKFNQLNKTIEGRLDKINTRVEEKLNEGFKKTNETFTNILSRLSKIDEAQKKIDSLSTEIVSLQDVLTDKKSRGIFGEVQLNQVLYSVFGEKNDKVFKIQHKLSSGDLADSVLFAPEPVGTIAIDSKFPLENFKKMTDRELTVQERDTATKAFKRDIKAHIDAIGDKYIIPGETSSQAIMFLPAEAIFAEVNAYHPDLVDYSQKKKVWICSPTTLMAILTTLQVVLQNSEREKHAHIIQEELVKLSTEFKRYETRWNALAKDIIKVSNDVNDIHITTGKIGKRFKAIEKVDLDDKLILDNNG